MNYLTQLLLIAPDHRRFEPDVIYDYYYFTLL